jgi:hypothetical protein
MHHLAALVVAAQTVPDAVGDCVVVVAVAQTVPDAVGDGTVVVLEKKTRLVPTFFCFKFCTTYSRNHPPVPGCTDLNSADDD